jgi:hypothetical protein
MQISKPAPAFDFSTPVFDYSKKYFTWPWESLTNDDKAYLYFFSRPLLPRLVLHLLALDQELERQDRKWLNTALSPEEQALIQERLDGEFEDLL